MKLKITLLLSLSIYLAMSSATAYTLPMNDVYVWYITNSAACLIYTIAATCCAMAGMMQLSRIAL